MSDNEGMMEDPASTSKRDLGKSKGQEEHNSDLEDYTGGPITTKLSKYDQDRQKRAINRRKETFIQEGGVIGRVYDGPAFESTPRIIDFKDFTLGEPHLKTIILTNVTPASNYFKILPIEDEFRDYFEIFYVPPGKMSAGKDCKVTIKFTPQLNENISTSLPVMTGSGKMAIPITCTYKRAVVSAESRVIDFGDVLFGEDKQMEIKLINQGALATMLQIKDSYGHSLKDKTEGFSVLSRAQSVNSESNPLITTEDNGMESSKTLGRDEEQEEAKAAPSDIFMELKFKKLHTIEGYKTLSIPIKYIPKHIREWSETVEITFENFMHSPPIMIELRGRCVDLPISVEKKVYDMEICQMDNTYRDELIFHNSGNTTMKVQVVIPKETKQFIQLNPSFGYIDHHSKLQIWVKVILTPDFETMCAKYQGSAEGEYTIPVQLVCSKQRLPVNFHLRIRVTTNKLSVEPTLVDFEMMYLDTAKKVEVQIQNLSQLPQYIYFYPLPKSITYEPAQIPLAILPQEVIKVGFIYRAYEVRKEEEFIRAKIVTGNISVNQIKLPYRVAVIKSPLKFSSLKIDFPTLQINETANHLLAVKNYSSREYICEFFLPYFEVCGLRVAPQVFRLNKGKSIEVNIEFVSQMKKLRANTMRELKENDEKDPEKNYSLKKKMLMLAISPPPANEEQAVDDKTGKKKPAAAADKKAAAPVPAVKKTKKELEEEEALRKKEEEDKKRREEEEERRRQEEELRFDLVSELAKLGGKMQEFEVDGFLSQHYTWLLPCYFKPVDEPETARSTMYVEVTTVSTSKVLEADKTDIDFGEIAVGFKKSEEIFITNRGSADAVLKMELLPLLGGFSVLNNLKPIPPGKTKSVIIQFEPYNQQEFKRQETKKLFNEQTSMSELYTQTLKLYSGQSSISVKLRGISVKPEVTVNPEDGLINLGACLPGERVEKTFEIKNVSNFSLDFALELQETGLLRTDRQEAFMYIPSRGTIKSGETMQVKLIFNPDRVGEQYFNKIKIDVPNQKTERYMFIKGACFPRQAFVCHYKEFKFPTPKDPLPKEIEFPLDFARVKDTSNVVGYEVKSLTLEFPKLDSSQMASLASMMTAADKGAKGQPANPAVVGNQGAVPPNEKRIVIGSCRVMDTKLEKPVNFDLNMLKDENSDYFTLEGNKGTVAPGQTQIIKIRFKQAEPDPFIANIKAFRGIGQWVEAKAELKVSGGYVPSGLEDSVTVLVKLRAYIEKI